MFTDAYPVEEFKGKLSTSGISFIFTWAPPRIGARLTTHYDLTCVPLFQRIPPPPVLSLANSETTVETSGLYSGITYNCSIFTVTAEGSSQPKHLIISTPEIGKCTIFNVYSHKHIYLSIAPSGAPEMFEAVPGERRVVFSWSPPPITQQNGPLTSYTLSCSPSPPSQPLTIPPESRPSLTVTGLSPNTDYTCSVTADNSRGSGPSENLAFRTVDDCKFCCLFQDSIYNQVITLGCADKYFQLRLSGLLTTCPDLVVSERSPTIIIHH